MGGRELFNLLTLTLYFRKNTSPPSISFPNDQIFHFLDIEDILVFWSNLNFFCSFADRHFFSFLLSPKFENLENLLTSFDPTSFALIKADFDLSNPSLFLKKPRSRWPLLTRG